MTNKRLPNILLVEGSDDLYVTANLWEKSGLPKTDGHISIIDMKGIDPLFNELSTRISLQSNLENLGILVDADTDLNLRWRQLQQKLSQQGYAVPAKPDKSGTILTQSEKPNVGVWIMPDNTLTGAIEDFLTYLIPDPAKDELWKLPQKCVDEAIALSVSIPRTKAQVHTYLAWKKNSGLPPGAAITQSYLDTAKPEALEYLEWLKALFPVVAP